MAFSYRSFKCSLIVQHAKKRRRSHGLDLIPRGSSQPLILLKLCPYGHSFILISLQKTLLGVALTNPVLQKEAQGTTLPTSIPLQKQRLRPQCPSSADAAVCSGEGRNPDGYKVWTRRGSSLAGVGLFFPLELTNASADVHS